MKLYKIIFFNTMMLGTLIAASSYSWFAMWMGLEINLLSIIPLLSSQKNMLSSESSLKYFITQAIASTILLMSVIMMLSTNEFMSPTMNSYFMMIMNSALLTKLGAAPFHFWFPEVMEGLNWMNCLILTTWQKIAPMILLMNNHINLKFLISIILLCLITSTTMSFNQISLRKILAFSSINHIGWMLSTTMMATSTWMIYFLIYTSINFNIIAMFHITKSFYLKQLSNIMVQNKLIKFAFMMNFLSLGGLPPFIGFLPKWVVINWMIINDLFTITILMIVFTLIMLYVYIRITFSSLVMLSTEPKIVNLTAKSHVIMIINFFTLSSLIVCTLLFNLM